MLDPGVALLGAVFTIDTSAVGVTGVVTVLVLLLESGSLMPGGRPMVAVLVMVPVALGETVPLIVMTTLPPEGKFGTLPLTLLPTTPMLLGQMAPTVAEPQLAETPVIALGTMSLKVVPLAVEGPALLIRIV
jgi:hypothetical protein